MAGQNKEAEKYPLTAATETKIDKYGIEVLAPAFFELKILGKTYKRKSVREALEKAFNVMATQETYITFSIEAVNYLYIGKRAQREDNYTGDKTYTKGRNSITTWNEDGGGSTKDCCLFQWIKPEIADAVEEMVNDWANANYRAAKKILALKRRHEHRYHIRLEKSAELNPWRVKTKSILEGLVIGGRMIDRHGEPSEDVQETVDAVPTDDDDDDDERTIAPTPEVTALAVIDDETATTPVTNEASVDEAVENNGGAPEVNQDGVTLFIKDYRPTYKQLGIEEERASRSFWYNGIHVDEGQICWYWHNTRSWYYQREDLNRDIENEHQLFYQAAAKYTIEGQIMLAIRRIAGDKGRRSGFYDSPETTLRELISKYPQVAAAVDVEHEFLSWTFNDYFPREKAIAALAGDLSQIPQVASLASVNVEEYAVTSEAQEAAIEAEIENATAKFEVGSIYLSTAPKTERYPYNGGSMLVIARDTETITFLYAVSPIFTTFKLKIRHDESGEYCVTKVDTIDDRRANAEYEIHAENVRSLSPCLERLAETATFCANHGINYYEIDEIAQRWFEAKGNPDTAKDKPPVENTTFTIDETYTGYSNYHGRREFRVTSRDGDNISFEIVGEPVQSYQSNRTASTFYGTAQIVHLEEYGEFEAVQVSFWDACYEVATFTIAAIDITKPAATPAETVDDTQATTTATVTFAIDSVQLAGFTCYILGGKKTRYVVRFARFARDTYDRRNFP